MYPLHHHEKNEEKLFLRRSLLNTIFATTVVQTLLSCPSGRGLTVPVTWMTDSTVRLHSAAFKLLADFKHRETGVTSDHTVMYIYTKSTGVDSGAY